MKIITENKVYVQKNDIAYLSQTEIPVPASIFMKIFGQGIVIIDDSNRYEFIEFTEPEEIDFFKKIHWIIDYNEFKDLSEDELIEIGNNMFDKSNNIAKKYNSMTPIKKQKNQQLVVAYELLDFQMHTLKEIILYKSGKLKMEIPKDIIKPIVETPDNKTYSIKSKNKGPKLFRSIFNKRKRK